MRIALLAGCLEPGRDGVGDYTHGLAVEALAAGVKVFTVALADWFAVAATLSEREGVPVLRLPAGMPWRERLARLRAALDNFDPEWISLQFVPYSFHPRGWVHGLAKRLQPLLIAPPDQHGRFKRRAFHLMFHELWLGAQPGAAGKHRLEGLWQRWLILRFTRSMNPARVHTSNPSYVRALKAHGVEATILPLFGSIPMNAPTSEREEADTWWTSELQAMGLPPEARQDWWVLGVFGSIHREWWPGEFFAALFTQPPAKVRRLALVTVGRAGIKGEEVLDRLECEFAGRLLLHRLGEQPPARVAAVFRDLDFGISTSPWILIGKSSAAAAMREHGVPVIVTRNEEHTAAEADDAAMGDTSLLRFDASLPGQLESIQRQPANGRRLRIVNRWLESLVR